MSEEREFRMQVEGLASDVMQILVKDRGLSLKEAMDIWYPSKTFRALERRESGLFYQSPIYVYATLCEELKLQ